MIRCAPDDLLLAVNLGKISITSQLIDIHRLEFRNQTTQESEIAKNLPRTKMKLLYQILKRCICISL